jgi:hypothetical protein
MDPIFRLVPINTLISQISINPIVWINNEIDLYKYTYLLTVYGLEFYNQLPIELKNRVDDKFSRLRFRYNFINQYQYPTAYDFIQKYYLFDTNRFVLNNFMIDLITRFMLIRKYYNSCNNEDDNILENINVIKKILKELNREPSEDETLIDEIIKKILEKKKSKLIDFYYTESRNTITKLLKILMTKKFDKVQKECNKFNKKYYKYKNKYINLKINNN